MGRRQIKFLFVRCDCASICVGWNVLTKAMILNLKGVKGINLYLQKMLKETMRICEDSTVLLLSEKTNLYLRRATEKLIDICKARRFFVDRFSFSGLAENFCIQRRGNREFL